MVNSILVPSTHADDHPPATIVSTITKKYTQTLQESSTTSETSVNGIQGNVKIIKESFRQSAHFKYNNHIKHWLDYSKTIGKIEVTHVLDFLSAMIEKKYAYSTINSSTKCAIAIIIHIPPFESLNKHPLINKYMTGIFNLRPP